MKGQRSKFSTAFWTLNVTGWLTLCAIDVFITSPEILANLESWAWQATRIASGFLITIPLRHVYGSAMRRTRSGWFLAAAVVVVSFAATNVWNVAKAITYIPFDVWETGPSAGWAFYFSPSNYLVQVYSAMWVLLVWSILYVALKISAEWWAQKRRLEESTVLLQRAQIQMLRYQMNPHFLFNSLNSIRSIINEDPVAARTMITDLAGFLRYSLRHGDEIDAPLHKEIEAVGRYLAIEKRRFEENLDISVDIDPAASATLVPSFLVQPLVENAIKHGRKTSRMPLQLRIKCSRNNGRLTLCVSNTGTLRDNAVMEESGTGTGLENVRQRLRSAFPDRHTFKLYQKDGWVTAEIEIVDAPQEAS